MAKTEWTKETWQEAYEELLCTLEEWGLPREVGRMIAGNLKGERSLRRMISYMRLAHPGSLEEIADEMIAIMEDRNTWILKKQAQESNARYTAWLNSSERQREPDE